MAESISDNQESKQECMNNQKSKNEKAIYRTLSFKSTTKKIRRVQDSDKCKNNWIIDNKCSTKFVQ